MQATATVNITYGTAAPKLGQAIEIKQTDSGSNTPWKESYDYDGLSRASSKTVSFDNQAYSYTTGYGYNQASQLTQMTYPSTKVVKYGFDSRGRLNTVGDANVATKYISSMSYQPSQQVGSIGLGNGLIENYGYSADRLQLSSQNVKQGTNTLMSMTYNYVADKSRSGGVGTGTANTGQLMDITGTVKDPSGNTLQRNESYNYDQVARLSQASGFYAQRTYTYDRFGNRTSVSGGASQTVTLQQPGGGVTNNRIASVNSGLSYQYDAAGDVTYDAAHNYGYDAESRLVKVDSGSTATYFYDSANRRVKKVQGSNTTYYVWEGSQVIAEYSNAPAGSGGTRFYHPDRLSNRMITDGSGVVKGTMDNLPFGEDGGVVGESEKHRFTSYERDSETSTDYAVNRQYSQVSGRFMRPDLAKSLNRYSYVNNDPINSADPSGLSAEAVWMLYRGTFLGAGGGFGGGADYAFWGDRIVDLPGFGTMWGSMSEFYERQWNARLRNTFDRAAAERAWQRGNYGLVSSILKSNPNVGLSVGRAIFWGELGAAFAEGYGEALGLIASTTLAFDDPIMAGARKALELLKKLRGPDFFIINVAAVVQISSAVVRGGRLPDDIVASIGGSTGGEISAFAGWILQLSTPATADVTSFLTGYSWSADVFFNPKTGLGAGIGPGIMKSPNAVGTRWALLLGGGVGGGVAGGIGFTYADLRRWFTGH